MSSGAPRSQSRIPEATTLTVTTARIASDAKRRSSRATRRRERLSCANIRASRCRRCARWTMTRPAKTNPTSAWMALRMWRSCRVPRAAAAKARRPRCTSQRDLRCHAVSDRARRSAGASAALLRAAPWFSASMAVSSHSRHSSRLRPPAAWCSPTHPGGRHRSACRAGTRGPISAVRARWPSATPAAITRPAVFQCQCSAALRERLPALTEPRAPGAEVVPPCAAGFRAGRAAPPGPLFGAECEGGAGAGSPAGRAERAGDRDQQAGQGEQDELPRLVHRQQ